MTEGRLEPPRAVELVTQVAGGLDAAHQLGLVHRDVKPANVLVAPRDSARPAFLTDFGLTRSASAVTELTPTGLAMGSADYMAPEQAQGTALDGRADVYALGCVLFRTLTGIRAAMRPTATSRSCWRTSTSRRRRSSTPPRPSRRRLARRVARAGEAPGDRQQTAGELAARRSPRSRRS